MTYKIAINGYGNLGRGAELAIAHAQDLELVAIFTRRAPSAIVSATGAPVVSLDELPQWADRIDVLANCGGSATDLAEQTPAALTYCNTVDTFDTHAKIPEYFAAVDKAARASEHLGLISVGWDPGLFSIARAYSEAVLPKGETTTFWGRGVSQGHSDALRRIEGVADAKQYTIPIESAMDAARRGEAGGLTTREKHLRECWVVLEEGADAEAVSEAIVTMPDYFADYDTTVNFISAEELAEKHAGMPHGGFVIRSGCTSEANAQTIEYSLALDSNPEFTGSMVAASARAVARMAKAGEVGARTLFDVAPGLLLPQSPAELRAHML
ncbi:MAG: diaminopimelate dehydrogenase [Actinomycetaceae bacterium]|nr:diaminopimelate dehydrogenase [Actinomycetaceae bacterium]